MIYPDNGNNGNPASPPSEALGEALLSSAYFAPIQWYQKLNRYDVCLIEQHDNFVKQTYRNRCVIAAANGPQTLSVPVEKFVGLKCQMKDASATMPTGGTSTGMRCSPLTVRVLFSSFMRTIYALSLSGSGLSSMISTGR